MAQVIATGQTCRAWPGDQRCSDGWAARSRPSEPGRASPKSRPQTPAVSSKDPTSHAADLAERILDEVSSADQNWRVVAICARELAELADEAASDVSDAGPGAPDQ